MDQWFELPQNAARLTTSPSMNLLVTRCPLLTFLNLNRPSSVDPSTLGLIATHGPLLQSVSFFNYNYQPSSQHKQEDINALAALPLKCIYLTAFHLTNCSALDDAIAVPFLSNCGRVMDLSLVKATQLTSASYAKMAEICVCITRLNLSNNVNLSDGDLIPLLTRVGSELQLLTLTHCDRLTPASLVVIGDLCVELTSLDVSHVRAVGDDVMTHITEHCVKLQSIQLLLTSCTYYGASSALIAHCPDVQSFALRGNRTAPETLILSAFFEHTKKKLTTFSLESWSKINSSCLLSLANNCRNLTCLELVECRFAVTDECFLILFKKCSHLRRLSFHQSTGVSGRAIEFISQFCAELAHLNITTNTKIPRYSVLSLRDGCPCLMYLVICCDLKTANKLRLSRPQLSVEVKGWNQGR
jgi:hypothetical protein